MRILPLTIAAIIALLPPLTLAAEPAAIKLDNPFFAFDNGVGRSGWTPEQQAEVLAELGYAGIGYTGTGQIPERLAAFDRHGIKVFSIYVASHVSPDGPSYDAGLKTAIAQLKGRDTIIWLTVQGRADNGEEQAVAVVGEIGDMAAEAGLRVALYPHVGFYVARVEDALRIVKKVDRQNVGASFNLCHFLKLDDEKNMRKRLEEAMPHLFLVSINGADGGDTQAMGWDRLIQTLDRGSYDMAPLLATLKQLGYQGPIGLQCYAIGGDPIENLKRSMSAWRKYTEPKTEN
ncbi:MAG: sugar phosphate isomerase/epimerase [Planctomycetes bacterium]|nr:sugar phosphate isomerase/epimerase [Planctomycetota bacterium]